MTFRRILAPLTLLLLLAGCASMPLSSMVQLAALGRQGLERVERAQLRQSLATREPGTQRSFSVSAPFSSRPAQAASVTFWADLKLSTDGAWIALLDAAELKFNSRS